MVWYVIEVQTNNGQGAAIPTAYTDRDTAEQKYHMILSAAAVSSVEQHGAILISSDMREFRREYYDRTGEETIHFWM